MIFLNVTKLHFIRILFNEKKKIISISKQFFLHKLNMSCFNQNAIT